MDYYDGALIKALSRRIENTYIFSNFIGIKPEKINYCPYYDGFTNSNKLIQLIRFLIATFKSSLKSKILKVDMVIIHIFSAEFVFLLLVLIPRLFNLKIAVILHDISSFRNNDNKFYKYIINNYLCDYIVVHNQYSFDELVRHGNIKESHKIHIIKHGGYLDFKNDKNKTMDNNSKLIQLEKSKKYILFFGQIKKVKGIDILLKSMQDIDKDVILLIAGRLNKDEFKQYDHLIDNYNISDRIIIINKYIEHDELFELIRFSKMIILPYKKIYQSGVLLMAMSFKLPVLASNLPPIKEVIKHEKNGLLFESQNAVDLANKVNKYITDEKLMNKISENAFNTIKNSYSWKNIAEKYLELLL